MAVAAALEFFNSIKNKLDQRHLQKEANSLVTKEESPFYVLFECRMRNTYNRKSYPKYGLYHLAKRVNMGNNSSVRSLCGLVTCVRLSRYEFELIARTDIEQNIKSKETPDSNRKLCARCLRAIDINTII
jgi:hypothetical protein